MSLISELAKLAAGLTLPALKALIELVREALRSDDQLSVIQRRAVADVAHATSQEAARRVLDHLEQK